MTPDDAHRVISELKALCDPRGHELLDAIGDLLITTTMTIERLTAVEGHRVIQEPPRPNLRPVGGLREW